MTLYSEARHVSPTMTTDETYNQCHSHVTTRAQQELRWATMATIDMGLKGGSVLCPFRGALGTRLIHSLWSARRSILPYQVASSTIQPFGHNDAGIQDRQRTDSIGQTVLQTVAQKLQWDSLQHLQQRRARSRVLMLYRIRNGLVAIPALIYLEPTVVHTRGFETSYRQI